MADTMQLPGDTLGMILAGGRVNELAALTLHRPKSAIPFGGAYRVIDCALTNLARTGVNRIGVLSQYRPLSLMEHVRDGRYWDLKGIQRSVTFLPPHTGDADSDWYKGTADALYQNISFIEHHKKPLTLIVSGDHIYRMDYTRLFQHHHKTGAEMTMCVTPVPKTSAKRFGIARMDADGMVAEYHEKPTHPVSDLASMTVYLFDTRVLIDELRKNAEHGKTFQVYDEILPKMVNRGTVAGCIHEGYWAYSRSLLDYYQANMDCLGDNACADLTQWKLHTNLDAGRIGDPPPVLTTSRGAIRNSIISPGAEVHGVVENSVISTGVVIEAGAHVSDSIIFDWATIKQNARVKRSIIDKESCIGQDSRVGVVLNASSTAIPNRQIPGLLDCGLTVIGKRSIVPDNAVIGTNVIIYPEVTAADYVDTNLPDGTTIIPG